MKRRQVFTIPNLLCVVRILLVPAFVVLYLRAGDVAAALHTELIFGNLIAASVIFLCALTDFFDGLIARKCNMISEVGKILDPFADKLLQCGIAVALMFRIPHMWCLFVIFFVKEFTMFVFQCYLYHFGKHLDGALWYGKVATAAFYLFMMIMILVPLEKYTWITDLLIVIISGFLLMAFVLYMTVFFRMYRELKAERRAAADSPAQDEIAEHQPHDDETERLTNDENRK